MLGTWDLYPFFIGILNSLDTSYHFHVHDSDDHLDTESKLLPIKKIPYLNKLFR